MKKTRIIQVLIISISVLIFSSCINDTAKTDNTRTTELTKETVNETEVATETRTEAETVTEIETATENEAVSETELSGANKEQDKFDSDIEALKILNDISDGEVISEAEYSELETKPFSDYPEIFMTDENEMKFYIKDEVNVDKLSTFEADYNTLYTTSDGNEVLICEKGKTYEDVKAIIPIWGISIHHLQNGNLLIIQSKDAYIITKDNQVAHFLFSKTSYPMGSIYDGVFSENLNYYVYEQENVINMINTGTLETCKFVLGDEYYSQIVPAKSRPNFYISNDGHLIYFSNEESKRLDGVWIASYWDEPIAEKFAVTKFGLNYLYEASLKGSPLYLDDEKYYYTEQYELIKISTTGTDTIMTYIDFNDPTYCIETKAQDAVGAPFDVSYLNAFPFLEGANNGQCNIYDFYTEEWWPNTITYDMFKKAGQKEMGPKVNSFSLY